MPSSFFSDFSRTNSGTAPGPLAPTAQWQTYGQHQQQPNQGPAGATSSPAADLDPLDEDDDEASSLDGGSAGDDSFEPNLPQDSSPGSGDHDDPPAAAPSTADPLRAERRRSNQLEKELRKARAQLSRFSEINPDEYARLQDAERKREEFERQVADRERQLNEANLRRVRSVEKERDEARCQVQNLRKERLLERLFREAEGRIGGDERGTFFDTFVTLCGGHFQLGEVDGRERLLPVDGKGQPLTADGVALSDGDYVEELRRHPVYSFLFQQRSGLYSAAVPETGHEHGGAVNLQTLSTAELYLEAVKGTTPRAAAPRR
jgi:F0F1-type ATP synthase, subunit b